MRVTVAAPAKVNLRLRVGPPEADGYHGIETTFCALELADTVVLRDARDGGEALRLSHGHPLTATPELGPPAGNLAVRAATGFYQRAGRPMAVAIDLVKRIPAGGGLGGGSSDAAAVLRALNRRHPGEVASEALLELAAELGSDVPFFLLGRPQARATGRGERLRAVAALPSRPVVVVIPPFPVSTAEAYGWLDERPDPAPVAPTPGDGPLDWETVARDAVNDFEPAVYRRHPELREIRDRLLESGAAPALLAGSGSTVFGVFWDRDAARQAARDAAERHPESTVVMTATRAY